MQGGLTLSRPAQPRLAFADEHRVLGELWGILEQQEASGRIKARLRSLPSPFHGIGVLQPMKPLPVHHFLHTLWCVGARTPNHQSTRKKAGFLGEIHDTKLTITIISNPQLLGRF